MMEKFADLVARFTRGTRRQVGFRWMGLRFIATGIGVATATGVAGVFAVHYERLPHGSAIVHVTPGPRMPVKVLLEPHGTLKPHPASYIGVYEPTVPNSYTGVAAFAAATGRHVSLTLYYSGFGQSFETAFAQEAWAHGAIPLVQIDPRRALLSDIADGKYDSYLSTYAYDVRTFGHAVAIGFGHEMNGDWYSWGYRHTEPTAFVAAWRHIVTLFRAQGTENVTWLWTVNLVQGSNPNKPVGRIDAVAPWWPGNRYVTWVGIDGYVYSASQRFKALFAPTIRAVRDLTSKPILLAETGVSPAAGKAAKIRNLFAGIRRNHLLGLIWFDAVGNRDWRLETDPAALAAFRKAAAGYPETHQ